MKWYDSVKVKLLGFFILISMIFLISIVITFFFIKEKNLEKNASNASNLATSFILQHMQIAQTKAEEIVLTLSSVAKNQFENNISDNGIISSILDTDKKNSINIVSGGVWYEPNVLDKNSKDNMLFYNRNHHGKFELVDNTLINNLTDYRKMEFYKISKKLKSGDIAWTSVYKDPVTHVSMITVVSPMYKKNKFVGTASIDIEIGKNNIKFWNNIEAKNMYLMMIDKDGNFIGKSNNLNQLIQIENIYKLEKEKLKDVLNKIKPALRYTNKYTDKNKNDIFNKIYLIKDDPVFNQESVISVYHFPHTNWNIIIGILKNQVMAQSNQTFKSVLMVIVILTLFATILGYLLLQKLFATPIESLNEQLTDSLNEDEKHYKLLECNDKGEIGVLVDNFNTRTIALEETQKREANEITKRMQNEKMLIQQSKMAAMGEMMDAVAHQWKQPLNALSMYSELIKSDFNDGSVDQTYIEQFRNDIQVQIDHMVNTLDEFRTFFRPNKEKQHFILSDIVNSVLFLTKDDLLKNRITVNITQNDEIEIDGSSNEFKHLVLNIINNAKDAFNDNKIEKRKINIRLINDKDGKRMEIEDNAGGIPENIIADIFKANVTTKEEGKGTGIGLYMSTQIAKKHHAQLTVKNQNDGACFTVSFEA